MDGGAAWDPGRLHTYCDDYFFNKPSGAAGESMFKFQCGFFNRLGIGTPFREPKLLQM